MEIMTTLGSRLLIPLRKWFFVLSGLDRAYRHKKTSLHVYLRDCLLSGFILNLKTLFQLQSLCRGSEKGSCS